MLDQGLERPFDTSYRPDIVRRGGSDGAQRNSLRLRSRVRVDDPLGAIPVLKQRLGSGWSPDGVVSYHPDVIRRESCHPVQAIILSGGTGGRGRLVDENQGWKMSKSVTMRAPITRTAAMNVTNRESRCWRRPPLS